MPESNNLTTAAAEDLADILQQAKSVQLATKSAAGKAEVSYAPVYIDEARRLHILISEIAEHTDNIMQTSHASAIVIEDEATAGHIFARRRATFDCEATPLVRDSPEWIEATAAFKARFETLGLGDFVAGLYNMADFHLVRLTPTKGRLVTGFGKAFTLSGERMATIEHFSGATGKGHRSIKKTT